MGTWPELHSGTNFNYVWDVGSLAWVKEAQPATTGGGTADVQYVEGATTDPATGTVALVRHANGHLVPLALGENGELTVALIGSSQVQIVGSLGGTAECLATSPSAGTQMGLVTRNIPSGTQDVNVGTVRIDEFAHANGAVGNLSVDENGSLRTIASPYTTAIDYDGSGNPIYIGYTLQGNGKASPFWQIRKLTYDGSNNLTDVQYASGSQAYEALWTARAGLAYS